MTKPTVMLVLNGEGITRLTHPGRSKFKFLLVASMQGRALCALFFFAVCTLSQRVKEGSVLGHEACVVHYDTEFSADCMCPFTHFVDK